MDLHGLPVTFLDTAGLREGRDVVESLGIERSQKRAEQADLRLFLLESPDERLNVYVRPEDIVVLSKADLRESGDSSISGLTGAGVDVIVERIADILEQRCAGVGVAVRERHRVAMVGASNAIEAGLKLVEQGEGYVDIAAEELRVEQRGEASVSSSEQCGPITRVIRGHEESLPASREARRWC